MALNPDCSDIKRWAVRQLADFDARQPGSIFSDGLVLDVPQAYELQSAVADLRRSRGEQIIGYKVGCTSPKIRAQIGIDHCVTGRLFDSEHHSSGAALSRSNYANLAIEGELAVELSRGPTTDDFLDDGVPACVARVFPVIELHHHVMRGARPSASELIAHNAIHAGFVAGEGVRPDEASGDPSLSIFVNDRLLEECAGGELIQTIHSSLKWLTEILQDRGEHLSRGQIVLTGSIPILIPLRENCRLKVESPPFGSVEVQFTP
jgi:2-keto-4-pentenoate hydratase